MSVKTMRLRFTVDDYYRMINLGMLKDIERDEISEVIPELKLAVDEILF